MVYVFLVYCVKENTLTLTLNVIIFLAINTGIYIDIDELIKQIREFTPTPKYRLTVYTFVARKPKFKTIDVNIRIFYGMLDGHSSLHQHVNAENNSSMTFSVQGMFFGGVRSLNSHSLGVGGAVTKGVFMEIWSDQVGKSHR